MEEQFLNIIKNNSAIGEQHTDTMLSMAISLYDKLLNCGITDLHIVEPAVDGVGISIVSDDKEAYFEVRVPIFLVDEPTQCVLFLTNYEDFDQSSILRLGKNGMTEESLIIAAKSFVSK